MSNCSVIWISEVSDVFSANHGTDYVPTVHKPIRKLFLENHGPIEVEKGTTFFDQDMKLHAYDGTRWVEVLGATGFADWTLQDDDHFVHLDTHANVVCKKITPDLETPIPPEFNRVYGEFKLPQPLKVCECGKDKHGFAAHSRWCEKFEE